MLVDVVFLRTNGEKRHRHEVLADEPVRFDLEVVSDSAGVATATLKSPWINTAMARGNGRQLYRCRLRSMRGAAFLLVGVENGSTPGGPTFVSQAWWCRLCEDGPHAWPFDDELPAVGIGQKLPVTA